MNFVAEPALFDIETDARRVSNMFSKKTFYNLLLREGAKRTFDQTFSKSLMGMNPTLRKFMGGS